MTSHSHIESDIYPYIFVFTDGACKGNPGKGGWGWIEYESKTEYNPKDFDSYTTKFTSNGFDSQTTNNRMELYAMINYLEYLCNGWRDIDNSQHKKVIIFSDSKYCLGGIVKTPSEMPYNIVSQGIDGWIRGWTKKSWKDVKNDDLWKRLSFCVEGCINKKIDLSFCYVKGHSGNVGNNAADKLANDGIR